MSETTDTTAERASRYRAGLRSDLRDIKAELADVHALLAQLVEQRVQAVERAERRKDNA